jgi:phosphatidylserine/phosphatidylglycerophosphate/cardiolipin synthase-like enzyme
MAQDYQAVGHNAAAPFTLKVHRGEGMALLAMNWKTGQPPDDFVGFGIEYREPGSQRYLAARNRLTFDGAPNPNGDKNFSSLAAPIQKFRWIVFPFNADLPGKFAFRVTPVFMDADGMLAQGDAQTASLELASATYPGKLNLAFTRGYVASQSFVDRYASAGPISTLLPAKADDGPSFVPTHPLADEALAWMGFEAHREIMALLDRAVADATAEVCVVAYDLSHRMVIEKLEALGPRLRIIIDDSADHGEAGSGENQADARLRAAGAAVKRQHMGNLQHNKTIVVTGTVNSGVYGSTNYTWRGFYVQSNNAIVVTGAAAIAPLLQAFDDYWQQSGFKASDSPKWQNLAVPGVDARVTFSPHKEAEATLTGIAADIDAANSSVLYSLAFLYQTPGAVTDAVTRATQSTRFVYGISDKRTGIQLQKPDGNPAPVYFKRLTGNLPPPFKPEVYAGSGTSMHHKFVVLDFETADARVWCGSYNFSYSADCTNGENLLLIKDRKIATAYMVEALRIFDAYHFRVSMDAAKKDGKPLTLRKPPALSGEDPWWKEDWTDARKKRDRELFA